MRPFQSRAAVALLFACMLSYGAPAAHSAGTGTPTETWWKHAVFYEIYPRSFQDSDGDGVGDLKGITSRLDYLKSLGIDAIWLTPIYPSPQADFGYDISDYTAIDPRYGTMQDFDELLHQARQRKIRVLMDLVMNHSSNQHPWFVQSESSRNNPRRDWYVWRDPKPGSTSSAPMPPNNWTGRTGQSAWTFDPKTKQFYYHYFDERQPDFNWRNPAVERAFFDIVRFWYKHGVSGFRLDAFNTLFEDASFRDAPLVASTNEFGQSKGGKPSEVLQRNQPEVHDVMRALRQTSDRSGPDHVLIGEVYTRTTAEMAAWYGANGDELQLPMNTSLGFLDKLDAGAFRHKLLEAETQLNGNQPLFVTDNHDRPRSWDRYGDGVHNEAIARVLATVLLATRGSALIYQGQEIGMKTTPPLRKEDVRDPRGILNWPNEGRDGERTPMQWNSEPRSGFTTGTSWLPIPPSSRQVNVALENQQQDSLLTWYRQLIALRNSNPALKSGTTDLLDHDAENALVWVRRPSAAMPNGLPVVVACNMTAQPLTLHLQQQVNALGIAGSHLNALASSGQKGRLDLDAVTLPPFGVLIAEVVPE